MARLFLSSSLWLSARRIVRELERISKSMAAIN